MGCSGEENTVLYTEPCAIKDSSPCFVVSKYWIVVLLMQDIQRRSVYRATTCIEAAL
jgi:hypothetical protein